MSQHTLKAYKFRLYPSLEQQAFFAKSFGCARFIWNTMLNDKIEHYKKTKTTLKNTPAQYKGEFEWLKEVDSLALANVQLDLQKAFQNFFKSRFGFPQFKKKGIKDSYTTNNQKGTVAVTSSSVKLPKVGYIKTKIDRAINGLIKSATVSESSNYQKQRIKVAKLYEKITHCRKDFLHKLSFNLIKNHDVIVTEDLNVKGMVKNRRLAKAISSVSWSAFTTMLAYKADWYGKQFVKIDQWFPSSKTCSGCGHVLAKGELTLAIR